MAEFGELGYFSLFSTNIKLIGASVYSCLVQTLSSLLQLQESVRELRRRSHKILALECCFVLCILSYMGFYTKQHYHNIF